MAFQKLWGRGEVEHRSQLHRSVAKLRVVNRNTQFPLGGEFCHTLTSSITQMMVTITFFFLNEVLGGSYRTSSWTGWGKSSLLGGRCFFLQGHVGSQLDQNYAWWPSPGFLMMNGVSQGLELWVSGLWASWVGCSSPSGPMRPTDSEWRGYINSNPERLIKVWVKGRDCKTAAATTTTKPLDIASQSLARHQLYINYSNLRRPCTLKEVWP